MKKKSLIAVLLIAVLATVGFFVHRLAFAKDTPAFPIVTLERGDLQSTVSATGTLSAVKTVSVGTQVSGQVSALLVDFNDKVKKGQLLARIDPTLAQQSVSDAQANLEKAQAQALQAQRDYNRNRELASSGLVARSEVEVTQSSSSVAQASVKSARVALQRAQQNLSFTNIYAPIDGVVVERNVDAGQTVAASLSAPQLFMIANDLSRMRILAQVGESDIAQIKEGQPVSFTVQALPGQTFKGSVQQVRLQSTTQDNVVNYTVVISVENLENKLLPGMTARAEFLTKSADDVLKVANAALRYKPTDEQLAELKARKASSAATSTSVATTSSTSTSGTAPRRNRTPGASGDFGSLYYLDGEGQLQVARVRTGLSDGTTTEVMGREVTEGMKVIAGAMTAGQASAKSGSTSPFQGNSQSQGGRGPRGGF